MGDDWLAQEMLARAWFERARLTGSYDDYAAAERALDRSEAAAPAGAGPHLLRAAFEFGMHRLDPAAAALARAADSAVRPPPSELADIEAMRGDIAFYRGDTGGALRHYARADAAQPGTTDFRRAVLHAFTGSPERARFHLDRAARSAVQPSVQRDAWFELQRGILALDAGRIVEAQAHFRRADARFPGNWLVEEHLAETLALTGSLDEAESRYRDVVARTGAPEFMDALADIARNRGDGDAARMWTNRAAAEWRRRLAMFPEATYGHAFDHCREKGDRACALDLARRNYRARPYGEAQAMLALALRESGAEAEAGALVRAVKAAGWRSLARLNSGSGPRAAAASARSR